MALQSAASDKNGLPTTHPLWRPFKKPTIEEIDKATVSGKRTILATGKIEVSPPDETWPLQFSLLSDRIQAALGSRVISIEHVGSTSVPGLYAKPVIDIGLTVKDSSDEPSYATDLENAGFKLVIREPEWEEHRCFTASDPKCNLHVFSPEAIEPQRVRAFRDWLRTHDDDREAYASLKRQLSTREFASIMEYNNEKSALIYEIYEHIFLADKTHPHTSQRI